MPSIELAIVVDAPIERVFDLVRSVDAHVATAEQTGERPVAGVTSGLMELGDEVTWSARHLGVRWRLTSRITAFDRPHYLRDSMVRGPFAGFDHDHWFEGLPGARTEVRDRFAFRSPFGPLGGVVDRLLVGPHMRRFLERRMQGLRRLAEGDGWRRFLPPPAAD